MYTFTFAFPARIFRCRTVRPCSPEPRSSHPRPCRVTPVTVETHPQLASLKRYRSVGDVPRQRRIHANSRGALICYRAGAPSKCPPHPYRQHTHTARRKRNLPRYSGHQAPKNTSPFGSDGKSTQLPTQPYKKSSAMRGAIFGLAAVSYLSPTLQPCRPTFPAKTTAAPVCPLIL